MQYTTDLLEYSHAQYKTLHVYMYFIEYIVKLFYKGIIYKRSTDKCSASAV